MRPDIESIQARADAATAGPWEVVPEDTWHYLDKDAECNLCTKGVELLREHFYDDGEKAHIHWDSSHCICDSEQNLVAGNFDYEEGGIIRHEDTVFIANARQDVPALLEYIAELEAKLATFKLCEEHYGPIMPCSGEACYHIETETSQC